MGKKKRKKKKQYRTSSSERSATMSTRLASKKQNRLPSAFWFSRAHSTCPAVTAAARNGHTIIDRGEHRHAGTPSGWENRRLTCSSWSHSCIRDVVRCLVLATTVARKIRSSMVRTLARVYRLSARVDRTGRHHEQAKSEILLGGFQDWDLDFARASVSATCVFREIGRSSENGSENVRKMLRKHRPEILEDVTSQTA